MKDSYFLRCYSFRSSWERSPFRFALTMWISCRDKHTHTQRVKAFCVWQNCVHSFHGVYKRISILLWNIVSMQTQENEEKEKKIAVKCYFTFCMRSDTVINNVNNILLFIHFCAFLCKNFSISFTSFAVSFGQAKSYVQTHSHWLLMLFN